MYGTLDCFKVSSFNTEQVRTVTAGQEEQPISDRTVAHGSTPLDHQAVLRIQTAPVPQSADTILVVLSTGIMPTQKEETV